jgi:hypothetical protein
MTPVSLDTKKLSGRSEVGDVPGVQNGLLPQTTYRQGSFRRKERVGTTTPRGESVRLVTQLSASSISETPLRPILQVVLHRLNAAGEVNLPINAHS